MSSERFGKYVLLHKLAMGGMGEIWLTRQSGPAGFVRFVAVKRLLPGLAGDHEAVEMFLDEARLAARLSHPNICQVFEFGSERGTYYLAMEYLHGESLASVLERSIKQRRQLAQPVVAHIVAQALEGLHFAHEAKDEHGRPLNLVHRDISPSNVFITYDGHVKLLDFGIAKAAHRMTKTVAGSIKGKFGYIAPEVYRGMAVDRRVDLFAMGVVLWETLIQRRLYKRAAEYEILRAIVEEPPPDPRSIDTTIAPQMAQTALKALAKHPSERFQTALEMRRAMTSFLRILNQDVDSYRLTQVMTDLYGRTWIELRSSVLESFKDASGSVTNAEALNPIRPASDPPLAATELAVPDFSVQAPVPTGPVVEARVSTQTQVARSPSRSPPSKSVQSHPRVWLAMAIAVATGVVVAAFATRHHWFSAAAQPPALVAEPAAPSPAPAPTPNAQMPAEEAPGVPMPPFDTRPKLATLVVASNARGSIVSLDDGGDRPSPSRYEGIEPGVKHRVRITAPAYEPLVREFQAQPGETLNLEIVLQKRPPKPATPPAIKHRPQETPINPDQPINPWSTK